MIRCEDVLGRLDEAMDLAGDPTYAEHLRDCESCRDAVAQARETRMARNIIAPLDLKSRLKRMPRLAPACEHAQELIANALDDDIAAAARAELVAHLGACPLCRGAWEGFATLREVGAATRAPARLRAELSLHPEQRIALRRQPRKVDFRLATAAVYLLAAATVLFVGDPGHIARAGTNQMERASLYARAAVENRLDSYGSRLREQAATAIGWIEGRGESVVTAVKKFFHSESENPTGTAHVESSDDGGKP